MKDFVSESPLFLQTNKLIELLDSINLTKDIIKSLLKIYTLLVKHKFLPKEEIGVVKAWVNEIEEML